MSNDSGFFIPTGKDYKEGLLQTAWNKLVRKFVGRWIIEMKDNTSNDELMLRYNIDGCVVDVYSREIRYVIHYRRWYFRNRHLKVYKFTSVIGEGHIADALRDILEEEIVLPDLNFPFFSFKNTDIALLNAYLDVVRSRLREAGFL